MLSFVSSFWIWQTEFCIIKDIYVKKFKKEDRNTYEYLDVEEIKNKITPKIAKIIKEMGYEFVSIDIKKGKKINLEVEIYSKDHNVSLKDCEKVSNVISRILDVEDPIPVMYNLLVSSPGVNRTLKNEREYEIFSGREVEFKVLNYENYNLDKSENRGILLGIEGDVVKFDLGGKEVWIDISDLAYTRLYFDVSKYFGGK